ncbi:hypothetical protein AB0J38_22940 [Streptomyces sp. NPDC050095]|uniref:hypothetical protein n=1 Tax=unclassified Streptomyces TaxID=2593676 RepID=UPI0034308537
MISRFRLVEGSLTSWVEVAADGLVLRQALFDADRPSPELPAVLEPAPWGGAVVASARGELAWLAGRFGTLGTRLYEATYGPLTARTLPDSLAARPVTETAFERAWGAARRDRHFAPRVSGPLPNGTRCVGTVRAVPWGPGVTGLFLDLGPGLPLPAFVDMGQLPRAPEEWPMVGAAGSYEVTDVRFHAGPPTGLQVRLRPTAPHAPAARWPRRGPR